MQSKDILGRGTNFGQKSRDWAESPQLFGRATDTIELSVRDEESAAINKSRDKRLPPDELVPLDAPVVVAQTATPRFLPIHSLFGSELSLLPTQTIDDAENTPLGRFS